MAKQIPTHEQIAAMRAAARTKADAIRAERATQEAQIADDAERTRFWQTTNRMCADCFSEVAEATEARIAEDDKATARALRKASHKR